MLAGEDRDILRRLAAEYAAIAQKDTEEKKLERWRDLNSLRPTRPLIWITEVPWVELQDHPDIAPQCTGEAARVIETQLRQALFTAKHCNGDSALEECYYTPMFLKAPNFGVPIREEVIGRAVGGIKSHHFDTLFQTLEDVEKIVPEIPEVLPLTAAVEETAREAFDDILPVVWGGVPRQWVTIWDFLSFRMDTQELLMQLVLEPDLMKALAKKVLEVQSHYQMKLEEMQLLTVHHGNYRVGSGAMGTIDDLEVTGRPVKTSDQWGMATAQIFGSVSPEMHDEFAITYEKEYLKLFKHTYYGCCEPLHDKAHLLRQIPNLRKVSVSPWCDPAKFVEAVGNKYVISLKPNPAIMADETFNPEKAEKLLWKQLEPLKGCNVEVVLKDISTVCFDWKRLKDWNDMARRICMECGENW